MAAPVLGTAVEDTTNGSLTPNVANVSLAGSGRGLIVIIGAYSSTGNNAPDWVRYDNAGTPINLSAHSSACLVDQGGSNDTGLQVWVTTSEPREDTNKIVTANYPAGMTGWMAAIPVTGLSYTTSPWGTASTSGDTSRTDTNTAAISASTDQVVLDAITIYGKTITLGGSQTSLANGAAGSQRLSVSQKAGAASVTMSQSWTGATVDWCHAAFAIGQAGSAQSVVPHISNYVF